jgi:hypothetical protein
VAARWHPGLSQRLHLLVRRVQHAHRAGGGGGSVDGVVDNMIRTEDKMNRNSDESQSLIQFLS